MSIYMNVNEVNVEELNSHIGDYVYFDIIKEDSHIVVMGTLTLIKDKNILDDRQHILDSYYGEVQQEVFKKAYLKDAEIEVDCVLDEYIYSWLEVDLDYVDKYTVVEE